MNHTGGRSTGSPRSARTRSGAITVARRLMLGRPTCEHEQEPTRDTQVLDEVDAVVDALRRIVQRPKRMPSNRNWHKRREQDARAEPWSDIEGEPQGCTDLGYRVEADDKLIARHWHRESGTGARQQPSGRCRLLPGVASDGAAQLQEHCGERKSAQPINQFHRPCPLSYQSSRRARHEAINLRGAWGVAR